MSTISARRVLVVLVSVSVTLTILGLGVHLASISPGGITIPRFIWERLNAVREATVTAWFSSLLLFVAALLLAAIASERFRTHERFARHWLALAFIFLYLSADEAVALHETTVPLLRKLNLGGLLYYPWVLVGIAAVLIFGIVYLRFFLHLKPRGRSLFLLSAVLYVGGAIGLEMVGARSAEAGGEATAAYATAIYVEELLEMLGVSTFIYALLDHIRSTVSDVVIRIE